MKSEKPLNFLPYQIRWLNDDSKIKIWEKSRRIGATYVQSYEDVRDCVRKKVPAVWFSSADQSAAKEYIDYCEKWTKLFDLAAKPLGEIVIDSDKNIKAGNYPQGSFTEADIEALVNNYDPKFCEAPITLDHLQKGPAYGWVESLRCENGKLKASFRDVAPELKEFLRSGKYKKISVEIYRELDGKIPYLKAVTFLGAAIPQVKGMEQVEFKEAPSDTYIFELEDSDNLLDLQEEIKDINGRIMKFIESNESKDTNELVLKLNEQFTNLSAQVVRLQEESGLRKRAEDELNKLKLKIRKNEFEQFLNDQITGGNLTPAQKDNCLNILLALDSVPHFDEEGYIEEFKTLIKSLPKQVVFDEIATKNKQTKAEDDVAKFENASEESFQVYKQVKELSIKENIPFKDALLKLYK